MPLAILLLILKGLAIVHVIRTGRELWWILVIVLLPGVGLLVYFLFEVLPSLNQSLTTRRAVRRVRTAVDPGRGVRAAALEHDRNPSVETASRLANELTEAGRCEDAMRVCNDARHGLFECDPKLLLSLANAQFAAARYQDTITTWAELRGANPDFRSPDGHLTLARALAAIGDTDRALEEYEAVARYYPGPEARVRYAMLLQELGRIDEANAMYASVLKDAQLAPRHVRKLQKEWFELAERESAAAQCGGARADGER